MIEPFEPGQVRQAADGRRIVSYGTSSYGYDIRCAPEFKVFTNIFSTVVDPKNFDEKSFVDIESDVCIIPPNSFALARTVEYFRIPRNVLTICLGKSTYARCGIIVNVTPFEPEWEGYVTLEFSNTTPLPAKIYAGEGCAQVRVLRERRGLRDQLQGPRRQVPGPARRDAAQDLTACCGASADKRGQRRRNSIARITAGRRAMRMDGQEESSNVEDVRGMSGGGGGGFGIGGRGIGIGSVAVALIAGWIFGINPLALLGMMSGGGGAVVEQPQGPAPAPPPGDRRRAGSFPRCCAAPRVVWTDVFRQAGKTYQPPKLVLFRTNGKPAAATGGGDGPVLLPERPEGLHRPQLLRHAGDSRSAPRPVRAGLRRGARGRPSRAEPDGDHAAGRCPALRAAAKRRATPSASGSSCRPIASPASGRAVRSRRRAGALEPGDIEQALNAASQIGDDKLQRQARGRVVPESFTHGTSAQRVSWFKRGVETGSVDACNTFEGRDQ